MLFMDRRVGGSAFQSTQPEYNWVDLKERERQRERERVYVLNFVLYEISVMKGKRKWKIVR